MSDMSRRDAEDPSEFEHFLRDSKLDPNYDGQHHGPSRMVLLASLASNLVLLGTTIFLGCVAYRSVSSVGTYEAGFHTDLAPIHSSIDLVTHSFEGEITLDDSGNFHTDYVKQQYTGPPSPSVDDAWHQLLALNIDLPGSEYSLAGRTLRWPDSGMYFTGLDVFHSLHCLNRIRQALYPEYYRHGVFDNPADPSRADHIAHCIDHLRQSIQCHSDLTPMEWRKTGQKIMLKAGTQHTCRDFSKVHEWASQRRTRMDLIEGLHNGSLFIVD